MNLKELRERLQARLKDLTDLQAKETLTDEDAAAVRAIVAEITELSARVKDASEAARAAELAEQGIASLGTLAESRGRVSGIPPQGDSNPVPPQDQRSLGRRVFDSEEFTDYRNRGGNGPLPKFGFTTFHEERAIANTALLPSDYLQPQRIPGIQRPGDVFGSLRDVLLVGSTTNDSLIFFQEASFTNNATEVAEATATTGTTGLKPESALTFSQVTAVVATIAHWIPITKQLIWNAAELQSYIEGRLTDGLKLREDSELLNGNGTAPNLRGLLNTSGIQVLDATYFTANPTAGATTPNDKFDRISRARTLIATVGRAQANFVVLNPADLEKYQTTTDGQKQYFGGGPMAAGVPASLWGLRIVVNENLAEGTALVGDGRQAQVWDRMQASVEIGTVNDQFIRNMFTLLAEERVGLTVYRPSAFATVELP
jgi:HK97 family phage major capsid protein